MAIAFNYGTAIACGPQATIHCCNIYASTQGDDLFGSDMSGNFSADPLFCDAEDSDYTLDGCSPGLPDNNPDGVDCGLIGALHQECGAIPILQTIGGPDQGAASKPLNRSFHPPRAPNRLSSHQR